MSWQRPNTAEVLKAIEVYLRTAYKGEPPAAVRARRDALQSVPENEFYSCAVMEREPAGPDPWRYRVRLGNQVYPHMKLVIERSPDGQHHLFRADTHDQHCCPEPSSREYSAYCQLMEMNQKVAQQIESAWAAEQLPTFKTFLKEDLARRRAETGEGNQVC